MINHEAVVLACRARLLTAVGIPSAIVLENTAYTPTIGTPYLVERYLPGGTDKPSVGTAGFVEAFPLYLLDLWYPANAGMLTIRRAADVLLSHFRPGTALTLSTGGTATVRGRPSPTATQLTNPDAGWAFVSVTIPLRVTAANT